MQINVGYLISYDYKFVYESIEQIYNLADKIIIAIDYNRQTWNGHFFHIEDFFFKRIASIDHKSKIEFYEDNFYIESLSPMECETRERNMLLKKMGKGWKIQLDSDEYILNPNELYAFLLKNNYLNWVDKATPISIYAELITLLKKTNTGYLYINNKEKFPLITNFNTVTNARHNNSVVKFYSGIKVLHNSWARSEADIRQKINNWGHVKDFDVNSFYSFWEQLDNLNYVSYKNFHPLKQELWPSLQLINAKSIREAINFFSEKKEHSADFIHPLKYLKQLIRTKFYS